MSTFTLVYLGYVNKLLSVYGQHTISVDISNGPFVAVVVVSSVTLKKNPFEARIIEKLELAFV